MDHFIKPKRLLNSAILLRNSTRYAARLVNAHTNHFQYLGDYNDRLQSILLTAEEVLWLMEKKSMCLLTTINSDSSNVDVVASESSNRSEGTLLSIQAAFQLLIKDERQLADYLVYCKLKNLGYVVWRDWYSYLCSDPSELSSYPVPLSKFIIFKPDSSFSKRNAKYVHHFTCHVAVSLNTDALFDLFSSLIDKETENLIAVVVNGTVSFLSIEQVKQCSEITCKRK